MQTNNLNQNLVFFSSSSLIVDSKNREGQLNNHSITIYAQKVFKKAEQAWNYLGKLPLLSRHGLNVFIRTNHHFIRDYCCLNNKISRVLTRLRLFSIVGVPFGLLSIKNIAQKIIHSVKLNDTEGVLLSSLSLTLITADVVDSLSTFINTVSTLATGSPIGLLSLIGRPLSYGMVGLGICSRSIQLIKTHHTFKKFKNDILSKNQKNQTLSLEMQNALKEFLKEKLELSDQEQQFLLNYSKGKNLLPEELKKLKEEKLLVFKEKKKAQFIRGCSLDIVNEFEKIEKILKNQEALTIEQTKEILERVERIQFFFKKKMTVDSVSLVASGLTATGFALVSLPSPPFLPFVFFGLSVLTRLSLLAYQDLSVAKPISNCA